MRPRVRTMPVAPPDTLAALGGAGREGRSAGLTHHENQGRTHLRQFAEVSYRRLWRRHASNRRREGGMRSPEVRGALGAYAP